MRPHVIILLFVLQCSLVSPLNAAEADILWTRAIAMVRQGQPDFAFMNFRMLVDAYPDFVHSPSAEFGFGEHHFLQNNLTLASEEFQKFYIKYPQRQESLIALAYLYKIAQLQGHEEAARQFQKEIASMQSTTFIFRDSKGFKYRSCLRHKHEMTFYIDRIEVRVDGQSLVNITY